MRSGPGSPDVLNTTMQYQDFFLPTQVKMPKGNMVKTMYSGLPHQRSKANAVQIERDPGTGGSGGVLTASANFEARYNLLFGAQTGILMATPFRCI